MTLVDNQALNLNGAGNAVSFNEDLRFDLSNNILYTSFFSELFKDLDIECTYTDEQYLPRYISSHPQDIFSICSLNAQSLHAKFTDIKNFLCKINDGSSNLDILTISESWVKDFSLYNIENYNLFGSSRPQGRGGGTAIYIHNSSTAKQILNPNFFVSNIFEATVLEINLKGKFKFILVSIYRPNNHDNLTPNAQIDSFLLQLEKCLDILEKNNKPVIFAGDFNLDLLKSNDLNDNSTKLLETFLVSGYIQTISKATRITNDTFSLIDNFFVKDMIDKLDKNFVVTTDISDHFPIISTYTLNKNKAKPPLPPKKRAMSEANYIAFSESLGRLSWLEVINCDCPNAAYDTFFNLFNQRYDFHFPLIQPFRDVNKKPINPFMFKGLLKCRNKKISLANISKISGNNDDKQFYIRYRNIYNTAVRTSKKLYYRRELVKAGKDSRRMWEILKESAGLTKKSTKIEHLIVNQQEINTNVEIANSFNSHFSSIGHNLTPLIPETNKNFSDFLPPRNNSSFFLTPITPQTMLNYILAIKPKKSRDDNDFSMDLLHKVAPHIAVPLAHIYNCSVQSGIFPDNMKISRVIPVFKSGDPLDPDNYRSIFMINIFSKVVEKIIAERLTEFLDGNNFFNPRQFGFRPHVSTNHAVLSIVNHISHKLNENKFVISILLDIRKCFDMINHDILFSKLSNAGVRGVALNWFKSYFAGRKQRVYVNGTSSSNLCDIIIGVLQGSILGVLLFLVFINDIYNATDTLLSFLYADDNTALCSADNLQDLINLTNSELSKLLSWYNANKLLIHPGKTKTLLFNPSRNNLALNNDYLGQPYIGIFLNMNNVNECNITKITPLRLIPNADEKSARLLGIQIDANLDLKYHFDLLYKKISRAIFCLKQMKHILNKKHLKLLYNSYIKSHIEYCCNLFCLANLSYIKPILILQKRAIRIICGANYRDHTEPLFKQERILPISNLIKFNTFKFMFDYRNDYLPTIFHGTWQSCISQRYRNDFRLSHANNMRLKNHHPLFAFPSLWNQIDRTLNIKNLVSRKEFNQTLFNYLVDSIEI